MAIFSLHFPSMRPCFIISSSYRETGHIGLGPTTMMSFNLNYLFKDPISKYRHILRDWGLGFQHMNCGEGVHTSVCEGDLGSPAQNTTEIRSSKLPAAGRGRHVSGCAWRVFISHTCSSDRGSCSPKQVLWWMEMCLPFSVLSNTGLFGLCRTRDAGQLKGRKGY